MRCRRWSAWRRRPFSKRRRRRSLPVPSCLRTVSSTVSSRWLAFNARVLELARTPTCRCSSAPASWRSSRATSTSSSWSGWPASSAASPPASPCARPAAWSRARSSSRSASAPTSCRPSTPTAFRDERAARRSRPRASRSCAGTSSTTHEQERLHGFFRPQVFPVLTPLAVDPAHPFPYISGLSLNLAVVAAQPGHRARSTSPGSRCRRCCRGWSPSTRRTDADPRATRAAAARFVPLEDVIAVHLDQLFPGMEVLQHHTFRVTRNEDLEVEEDDAENLLQALEKELLRRRFGPPVRLEVAEDIDQHVRDLLVRELGVSEAEVYELPEPLDLRGAATSSPTSTGPTLHYPKFVPATHRQLAEVESAKPSDIFAAMQARDVLLHHPYDSFSTSVQAFLEQAAADPRVLAIKQTLYRTSRRLPDRRRAHRRRRGRQAGARARRDQGPLRRAGQHQLGAQAGAGRRPRRLRHRRAQDALQAQPRRPPGVRRAAPLLPHRHRQLQPARPPASTRTWACSPATRWSARTSAGCSTSSPATRRRPPTAGCWWRRARCAAAWSTGSSARSRTTRRAGRRACASR